MNLKRLVNNVSKFFNPGTYSGGSWGWSVPGQWNRTNLLEQYERYVYPIISSIAENAAKVTFEVSTASGKNQRPVLKHGFLDFIKNPNPDFSQFQFLEAHFTYMKLAGESFWYIVKGARTKMPKEAYLLRPDIIDVAIDEKDPRGLVKGYIMYKPDGTKIPFDRDEILHFKTPNPKNRYRGLGPVQAGKTYIETEEYGAHWTKNSLFNSGRPSGILNIKGLIGNDEFEKVKRQFREEYSGTQNAGKTFVTKGGDGLDYQKLGMELGEVALKDLKDMTRDDIMIMFKVSKTILGITDDVNRANSQTARAVFIENIIIPELDRFTDHLQSFLMPIWGDQYILGYEDPTLITDADKLEMYKAGHNKWLTTNDIRSELDYDPLPGGDVIREPLNLLPTQGKPAADVDAATPEPPKPSEEDPEDKPEDGEESPGDKKAKKSKSLKKKSQQIEVFHQLLFKNQEQWEKRYKMSINKELDLQRRQIVNHNKFYRKKILENWLFDKESSKKRLVGELMALTIDLMQDQSEFAFDLAGNPAGSFELTERIRNYIIDRLVRIVEQMNEDTLSALTTTILEGIQLGESVNKLVKRIEAVYEEAKGLRAERIARTETLAASNKAAEEAYRQSPLVVAKEWSAEADACQFCQALDGKVVGLEEDFAKEGQTIEGNEHGHLFVRYEDIGHPPAHPNCKCAIIPVAQS